MVREVGLPRSAIEQDLDRLYRERLLSLVRSSTLDAVLLLAQEVPRDDRGRELPGAGTFFVPNDYVLGLAREHPEFVPAVSIHPARPDAMDELERCLAEGARVMKCLPNCQNINCSDARYAPFWERMAETGMILLAHTGGEVTLPVIRAEYADPRVLELPLRCGVKVIAAHCSGRSCFHDRDYTGVLLGMFQQFPNLYGDNSALCSPVRSRTLRRIIRPELFPRIVHGSDFPIPVSGLGPWVRRVISWRQYRSGMREGNVLERDFGFKRAMGFPKETFTRLDHLMADR